jgi:serine/threonine-protein kinase
MAGIAWETQGDRERATAAYEEAVAILERAVAERPCDERRYAALGLAYAGLGRREEALRNARRGAELLPLEEDALWGTEQLFTLAAVLARCGEVEESIRILERLLTVPSRLSAPNLRNHYLLRPLWNEPAFLDLLEREPGRVF